MSHVIIATNDLAFYETISAALESMKYEPVWVTNGLEVLEQLNKITPTVVFLDSNLTILSAHACCKEIRQDRSLPKELPIFLATDDETNFRAMERAGFTGEIPKRHDAFQLREFMSKLEWK